LELEKDKRTIKIYENNTVSLNFYSDFVDLGRYIIVVESTFANIEISNGISSSESINPIAILLVYHRENGKLLLRNEEFIDKFDKKVRIAEEVASIRKPEVNVAECPTLPDIRVLIDVWNRVEWEIDWHKIGDEIIRNLKRNIVFEDDVYYDVNACYIISTYFYDFLNAFPYLWYYGAIGSGKTRAMITSTLMSYRGVIVEDPSEASIYRLTDSLRCTLGIDEKIFTEEGKRIISASYKRGIPVARVEPCKQGFIVKLFESFSPKIFSFIDLPSENNLLQRIIAVNMLRGRPEAIFDPSPQSFKELRNKLYYARLTRVDDIFKAKDEAVEELKKRDLWGREIELYLPIMTSSILIGREDKVSKYILEDIARRRAGEEYHEEKLVLEAINEIFKKVEKPLIGGEKIAEFKATDLTKTIVYKLLDEDGCLEVTDRGAEKLIVKGEVYCKKLEEEYMRTYSSRKIGRILANLGFKDFRVSIGSGSSKRYVYQVPWSKFANIAKRYNYQPEMGN
jgi:hypothetical protein